MISYPIKINGVLSRVLQSGTSGPPIVFVHGTGGRAERWQRNLDAIAQQGFRTYAFDLPGHGFAAKGDGVACSVPAYAELLAGVIEKLGLEKPVVVGTSLGGHVAAYYASKNAGKVSSLVLVGSMGLVPIGAESAGKIQAGANNQSKEGVATKMARVIFDAKQITPDMIQEEFEINNSPGAKESFATLGKYIVEQLDHDVVGSALAGTGLPVLLVWGDQDKTVPPAVAEKAQSAIPGSKRALIADTAHTSYFENATAFNTILLDFLAGRFGSSPMAGVTYAE